MNKNSNTILEIIQSVLGNLVHTYYLQAEKNVPGFASAWDFRNLDLPDFRVFMATKSDQHSQRKRPAECDGDNNKVYLNITDNFYPLVHAIIRLDGS